jgi:hypothetical protein
MLKQRPRVFQSLLSTFITRVMSKVRPRVDSKSTLSFVRYIVFYLPRCEGFFLLGAEMSQIGQIAHPTRRQARQQQFT